jgi:hypothetical protein
MSFATLKRNSGNAFEKLTQEIEKMSTTEGGTDDRFWKPEMDKAGNGYAVIRFLPPPEGEDVPWAKVWSHAFQGPGGWYIENSLTTLNKKDPVGELNRQLWNSGSEKDKEVARKQKRKLSYYSNIYVIKDPAHPENEGKVFLYKFGKKIFDKITEAMQPAFADEKPINPFDFWTGADFKIKLRKVDGYWNYDKSEFADPGTLGNYDDDQLEAIYSKTYSLAQFTSDSNFKTFEELQKRLNDVLNSKPTQRIDRETYEDEESQVNENITSFATSATPSFSSRSTSDEDEDDTLSYFARLAEED